MIDPDEGSPRWAAYSHDEILAMVRAGPGPAASLYASGRWEATWFTVSYIEANLARSVAEAGGGWAGQAADAMTAGTTPLGQWAGRAAEQALSTAKTIDAQARYADYTRREMPPAAHPEIPVDPGRGPRPYMSGVPIMTDWAAVERDRDAATARARDLMATYGRNSYDTLPGMLASPGPPSVVVQNTATGTLHGAGVPAPTLPAGVGGPGSPPAGAARPAGVLPVPGGPALPAGAASGSRPAGAGPGGAGAADPGPAGAWPGATGVGSPGSGPGATGTGSPRYWPGAAGTGSAGSGLSATTMGLPGPAAGTPVPAGSVERRRADAGPIGPALPGEAGARPPGPGHAGAGVREPPALRDRPGLGPPGGPGAGSSPGDGAGRSPGPLAGRPDDGLPNGLRGAAGQLGDPSGGLPRGPTSTGPLAGSWTGRNPANPLPEPPVLDRGSPERPFPSSAPAAGRAAGEGLLPMGAGGMGRARGEEHRRPTYLVDDGSAFADDRRIPGSVINERWPDA